MTRFLLAAASLLAMTACNGGGETPPGAPPPPGASSGSPGGAGAGAPDIPVEPKHSQAELAASGTAITLSGELKCAEGSGPFVLHLFPPPESEGGEPPKEGASPPGPVAGIALDEPGVFELLAPKGGRAVLVAFQDVNQDGKPTPGESLFFAGGGGPQPTALDADLADLVLDCKATLGGPGGGERASKIPPAPVEPGSGPTHPADGEELPGQPPPTPPETAEKPE